MKINSVSCNQFAGLRNLKPITFTDGLNILYGENESGKSTLVGLIYSLLCKESQVGNRDKTDKDFRNFYFPAEVKSGHRGNTVDGELHIEGDDGEYIISKTWADKGNSGHINTPTAVLNESVDKAAYKECLKDLLKYGDGVYKEAVFANQKGIDDVLKNLFSGKLESDLSSVASAAMLEMGGISSEKFIAAIDEKMNKLEDSWDWKIDGPKGGRGIDNKISRNVGEILEVYYKLEENKKKLRDLKEKDAAVSKADSDYNTAVEKYNAEKQAYDEFMKFSALIVNYKNTKSLKSQAESDLKRRQNAQREWPIAKDKLVKAINLKHELDNAKVISLWKDVERISAKRDEAEKKIATLALIAEDDIMQANSLTNSISTLERRMKSFSALMTFTMENGYEVIVTSEIDGHRIDIQDGKIELSEAVKVEIPGVAVFHMSAVNIDAAKAAAEIKAKNQALADILSKYNVKTVDDLVRLQKDILNEKADLERAWHNYEVDLKRVLAGKDVAEVKAAYEAVDAVIIRKEADISAEISKLTDKSIETFISLQDSKINNYMNDFLSEKNNEEEINKLTAKIADYNEDLRNTDELPIEYKKIENPEETQKMLKTSLTAAESKKDNDKQALMKDRAAVEQMQEAEDYMDAEELVETVMDNERELQQSKEEYHAWKQIKREAENILKNTGANPLESFEEDFRKYLTELSDERIELSSLSPKLAADIYSGDNKMTYDLLSEGTKDTVSLAFRLAVIKFLFPEGGGLAVFDDPFTDMDANRKEKACALLNEFAKDNQIIFVTCDRSYKDALKGNFIDFAQVK